MFRNQKLAIISLKSVQGSLEWVEESCFLRLFWKKNAYFFVFRKFLCYFAAWFVHCRLVDVPDERADNEAFMRNFKDRK